MRVIIIIILIYFGLMLFGKYVLPFMVRGYVKHYSKKFYDEMEQNRREDKSKEGEVKISKKNAKIENKHGGVGEYVDYEEVK